MGLPWKHFPPVFPFIVESWTWKINKDLPKSQNYLYKTMYLPKFKSVIDQIAKHTCQNLKIN